MQDEGKYRLYQVTFSSGNSILLLSQAKILENKIIGCSTELDKFSDSAIQLLIDNLHLISVREMEDGVIEHIHTLTLHSQRVLNTRSYRFSLKYANKTQGLYFNV